MRFEKLLDEPSAAVLHAAWLQDALAPASSYGRREFDAWEPFRPGEERAAAARAQSIEAHARSVGPDAADAIRDVLRGLPDISATVARAGLGDTLDDPAFLELLRFCDGVKRAAALMPASMQKLPQCEPVAAALEPGRSGAYAFYLDERFDPALAQKRGALLGAQRIYDRERERLAGAIAGQLGRDDLPPAEFIVMRDSIRELPKNVRVIREAPTYFLCEIELDENALGALRERDAADAAVAREEERVRAGLSAIVATNAAQLEETASALGGLDVLIATVRFTQRFACAASEFAPDARIELEAGSLLPMAEALRRENREYHPISIAIHGAAVLTGPNMGGKTVALQTCGFLALLAAFGVPVPAKTMRSALFARVAWVGIGLDEPADGLLSSFALEIVRLRDVLDADAGPMLLLVDEFARTTNAAEGRALLLALIERLGERGACALIATHLFGIAAAAGVAHFSVRGSRDAHFEAPRGMDPTQALSAFARSMDYRIDPVTEDNEPPGDAIRLAGILGMDRPFLDTAWQRLAETKGP